MDHERHLAAARAEISRRHFLAGIGSSAFAVAFLAACGDDSESDSSETPTATATSTTATTATATPSVTEGGGAGYPRTITHHMGETTLETHPERIVAASDFFELDNLLAIGARPVLYGYSNRYDTGVTPRAEAAGEAGLERYDLVSEFDLERIAAAELDVIFSDWYWGGDLGYDQLSAIAPTISLPAASADETGWRLPQRAVGEALRLEDAAEEAIAETEQVLDEQRARLATYTDRVVTMAYGMYDGTWFAEATSGASGRIVADLGMTLAAIGPDDNAPISEEQLNLLEDADLLISYDTGEASMEAWESHPLFRGLPAVREGRYVVISPEMLRAIFSPTTLSVRWALPRLADAIIEAAEGRGRQLG